MLFPFRPAGLIRQGPWEGDCSANCRVAAKIRCISARKPLFLPFEPSDVGSVAVKSKSPDQKGVVENQRAGEESIFWKQQSLTGIVPMKKSFGLISILIGWLCACTTTRDEFNPHKSFPPDQLQQDYQIFRGALEQSHPSLYWYTSKDSMDHYFDQGLSRMKDSMTETQFRAVLSYVVAKINCGHTAIKYSKNFMKYLDTSRLQTFPLGLKFWQDTMVVTINLNRQDSVLRRGTVLTAIEGQTPKQLRDSLFQFLVTDGTSLSGKYQTLSTGFTFANWYKYAYGLPQTITLDYLDSLGNQQQTSIAPYDFKNDTMRRLVFPIPRKPGEKRRRPPQGAFVSESHMQLDTASATGFMVLNTFDKGNHLKKFIRSSFKTMDQNNTRHLVIDVRSNGGGEAGNSTLLTRYLIDHKFKLADSLYAISRGSQYDRYVGKSFMYNVLMRLITHKESDGKYHFGYFERHYFHPKQSHHFNGDSYILIGGNSFSATTLFAGALKGQQNVTLVGEETGGGYYGNSAWIIEELTLPNTQVRFLLPKFRLVVDRNRQKDGHGVLPDVWSAPTVEAIRKGVDFKTNKARELISKKAVQTK